MSRHSVLVTGASGFIGEALCQTLLQRGYSVTASFRQVAPKAPGMHHVVVGNINGATHWQEALDGVDCVVHCAAISQVSDKQNKGALEDYFAVNYDGTVALAQQAAAKGIKRFVFLSSIMVHGDSTDHRKPFSVIDIPAPVENYALSKWKAEQALQKLAQSSAMEIVIIRPAMVYGPGVAGNFARLLKLVESGMPLPFAKLGNKRGMIGLDNLLDFIMVCLNHPDAANQVFLASDGEDLSMSELLQRLGQSMRRRTWLFSLPIPIMMAGARLIGLPHIARRLLGSLEVDITHTREVLGWSPPIAPGLELQKTVDWYLSRS